MNSSVSDFYDKRGEQLLALGARSYGSQSFAKILRAPYEYYEKFLPLPKNHSTFLDVGCGTGVHSILPAKLGYKVTAVDISQQSVMAAKKLAKQYQLLDQIRFIVGDVLDVLKQSSSFDVIFASGSLYYLELREIIPLIFSRLKDNGHFFCIETNGSNWIWNQIRKIKYLGGGRDEQTLNGLLKLKDIDYISSHFFYVGKYGILEYILFGVRHSLALSLYFME